MKLNFEKGNGLIPAIIQDAETRKVLMLGYMNKTSLERTLRTGHVTFYSRSRETLWMKGETSGNFLDVVEIRPDCDNDTLLILVRPHGPVCHTGKDTCFDEINKAGSSFLYILEQIIRDRIENPVEGSYTNKLLQDGIKKIAQKVGEEATETIVEALTENRERLKEETADLLYHLLVLLAAGGVTLAEVEKVLGERHISRK